MTQFMKDLEMIKTLIDIRHNLTPLNKRAQLYKYLTFESACQMLENINIQFTAAKELDDPDDCNISMINFDCLRTGQTLIEKQVNESVIQRLCEKMGADIDSFHICSLGTSNDNEDLWNKYANNDGICIEINYEQVINSLINSNKKTVAFMVNYVSSTKEIIPFELYQKGGKDRHLFFYFPFEIQIKQQLFFGNNLF